MDRREGGGWRIGRLRNCERVQLRRLLGARNVLCRALDASSQTVRATYLQTLSLQLGIHTESNKESMISGRVCTELISNHPSEQEGDVRRRCVTGWPVPIDRPDWH